eukprot:s2453_g20.t1
MSDLYPWRCNYCQRLNRKVATQCAICQSHWSTGTRHNTEPKAQTQVYQWGQEDAVWNWQETPKESKPRSSTRSSSARRRAKGQGKDKGKKGKQTATQPSPFQGAAPLTPWPTTESIFGQAVTTPQGPIVPEAAASSSTSTAAALTAHVELVTAVRKTYPDVSKAPQDIQAALKKADQNLSKQIGSDLHKASSQIEKSSKQLTSLRSARAKHKDTWMKHLRDSVATWESQIKAYQEQQQIYIDQINRAKSEISLARRALQTVSKHAGNVAIKTEEENENVDEDPELDIEEQTLARKVQELLQQSANLAIPSEIQEIQDSEEDSGHKSKRPRSLEPFGHAGALEKPQADAAM